MKNTQKLFSIVFLLALSMSLLLASSVNAATSYGYKAGDQYAFTTKMNYSVDTPTGDASSSMSNSFTIKIIDVAENLNSHDIDIKYTLVGNSMDPITQGNMEGNVSSFTSGGAFGAVAALFVTSDWDSKSEEWSHYVDWAYSGVHGYSVESVSHNGGEFSVTVNLDLDSAHSNVDFNGDGIHDAYTGTLTHTIKYDSNGVLQSASITSTTTSPDKGTITYSTVTDRSSSLSGTVAIAIIFGTTAAVAALALGIGFFLNKRKAIQTA